MPELRGQPPGRAGRQWIRDRLDHARHAAELLDRKLRLLRAERDRCAAVAAATGARWAGECREAERWLLRAGMLGGQRELDRYAGEGQGAVTIRWERLMGLRYPAEAAYRYTDGDDPSGIGAEAVRAYRSALDAAVAHAVATAAQRTLDIEIAQTRRIVRALDHGRIPQLESALTRLNQHLDETERAELSRLHHRRT